MAITDHELYGIYPGVFDSLTLANLTMQDAPDGSTKMIVLPGGSVDPMAVLEINRKPVFSFTAHDLAAIFGTLSPILGYSVTTGWKVQYQQEQDGGTFTSGSTHVRLKGTKGKLLVDSISAQQDQQKPVDVMLKFYPLWDGTTVDSNSEPLPVKVEAGQALVGEPAVGNVFKLGSVIFEGSKMAGVQSVKLNFGLGYNVVPADGEKVARIGTIDKRDPTLETDVHNLSLLVNNGHGLSQASAGMVVYFRNVGYPDNQAQHVSFTIVKGAYETSPSGLSDQGKAMTKLLMTATRPSVSAGSPIITVNLGVVMP